VLDFSLDYGVTLDARVLAFTLVVSLVAGIVSGLFPALRLARGDVNASLKDADPRVPRWAGRRWIVIPQLALSLVALVSAGLFLQSFRNVSESNPGFVTEGLLLASVNLALQGYDEDQGKTFHRQLIERVEKIAGVESASLASPLPLDAFTEGARLFNDEGRLGPEEEGTFTFSSTVGVDYFETMGTALVHGRAFQDHDVERSRPVAIVNETLARRFWPEENALGKLVRLGRDGPAVEIVGVARDGKYVSLGEEPRPYLFLPLLQGYQSPITILVRTAGRPKSLEPGLREAVRTLDPTLPVYGVKTVGDFLNRSLAGPKALALTVSVFAALALALTAVGVYGLMSFSVSQKRREIGIRMALGASKRDVLCLFLRQAASLVGMGLFIGLVVAWMSTRVMASLLYGVGTSNFAIFVSVAILLAVVALAGSFFPSLRATKLNPIVTLRDE
jgi:predicted permease